MPAEFKCATAGLPSSAKRVHGSQSNRGRTCRTAEWSVKNQSGRYADAHAKELQMTTVSLDQLAGPLAELIANLGPGEEIIIVDGDVALAKLTSATKVDQSKLRQLASAEAAAVDDQANDFARYMT
jgi:antitoxin (DNA-binding transcriptional repressor) of toxin-antitoxin stability system